MTYQSQPISMWFDRRIVYRKSLIHGIGTCVIEDVRAGEPLIWVTGGLICADGSNPDNRLFEGTMYNAAPLSATQQVITALAFHYYINHSCEPNIIDQSQYPTYTHYIALRDIRADEEPTADYSTLSTLKPVDADRRHADGRNAFSWDDQFRVRQPSQKFGFAGSIFPIMN